MAERNDREYTYLGHENEVIPDGKTCIIVHEDVTVIRHNAFEGCEYIVSVVMNDGVTRIENYAFSGCLRLKSIRFSKTLLFIGNHAFGGCRDLEVAFLPSTITEIQILAFNACESLRLLNLPDGISVNHIRGTIIRGSPIIEEIAEGEGITKYRPTISSMSRLDIHGRVTSSRRNNSREFNSWLLQQMNEYPLHKICCDPSVSSKKINNHLGDSEADNNATLRVDSTLQVDQVDPTLHPALQADPTLQANPACLEADRYYGMTPLHMLAMNPHASRDTFAVLVHKNLQAVFRTDDQEKTPMQHARESNVPGLIRIIHELMSLNKLSG